LLNMPQWRCEGDDAFPAVQSDPSSSILEILLFRYHLQQQFCELCAAIGRRFVDTTMATTYECMITFYLAQHSHTYYSLLYSMPGSSDGKVEHVFFRLDEQPGEGRVIPEPEAFGTVQGRGVGRGLDCWLADGVVYSIIHVQHQEYRYRHIPI